MPEPKYEVTERLIPVATQALRNAGMDGYEIVVNEGEEDFNETTDDEISFVAPDGRRSATHIQSGPYGCSANVGFYDEAGELTGVRHGMLRSAYELDRVAQDAVEALREEAAAQPVSPAP